MSHLETIVELQEALTALRRAEQVLAGVPDWMQELHGEHSARRTEIEAVEARVDEATKARRRAEAAIQDTEERLRHFQGQVSQVRTQREYAALLQEIDTTKAQIKALEEEALGGLEAHDEAERQLGDEREAFADLDQRYGEALARWGEEKPAVEQQAESLRARVEELRGRLPRPLVALFDRLYEHREGGAVAPVRRVEGPGGSDAIWHCAACNYRVRLQVVADIRARGALVQCDGCKRILNVEEGG